MWHLINIDFYTEFLEIYCFSYTSLSLQKFALFGGYNNVALSTNGQKP